MRRTPPADEVTISTDHYSGPGRELGPMCVSEQ